MKNRIVAALVLSMIFAGTSVAAYNTQNVVDAQVIENDLHPSDGTPTLFKVKTPVYSNKKLTGKPRAYIKKGTVVRAQSKSSMIYNGILVYSAPFNCPFVEPSRKRFRNVCILLILARFP